MASKTITIMGAGIQGVCAALAAAHKGYQVNLIEREATIMQRTSIRNEAKIHLGFVYANDPTNKTGSLMLESAMHFGPLLDSWLRTPIQWDQLHSTEFLYVIAHDSMVPVERLYEKYAQLETEYKAYRKDGFHYLGIRPANIWQKGPLPDYVSPRFAQASVETKEYSLHLTILQARLQKEIVANDKIRFFPNHTIAEINRRPNGFRVNGKNCNDEPFAIHSDILVNCLWDYRLKFDQHIHDQKPKQNWVYRLKYGMRGQLPAHLKDIQSMTFVLGPYGDVVTYPSSPAYTYLSWYPAGMVGWSTDLAPPKEWDAICRGNPDLDTAKKISRASLAGLENVLPGIKDFDINLVIAGVIFGMGNSDIDQQNSGLHQRHEIGVEGADGYYTINTGKFTCGPLFAQRFLDLIA